MSESLEVPPGEGCSTLHTSSEILTTPGWPPWAWNFPGFAFKGPGRGTYEKAIVGWEKRAGWGPGQACLQLEGARCEVLSILGAPTRWVGGGLGSVK